MAFRLPLSLRKTARPLISCYVPSFQAQVALLRVHAHSYPARQQTRYANGYGAGPQSPGQVGPQPGQPEDPEENSADSKKHQAVEWGPTLLKMFESALTTAVSLTVLG